MSALLSADDLNDFITPGVACIKPATTTNTNTSDISNPEEYEIQINSEGNPIEVFKEDGTEKTLSPAQINLSDCLACSGCITSAESVLVSLQSHTEVLSSLENNPDKIFVCSISHQSRASLATAFGIDVSEVDRKIRTFFIDTLNFKYVVGMGLGREISLEYSAQELLRHKADQITATNKGPILCSSCPGWVCYVEKAHSYVVPYMSQIKSPQQITGTILKKIVSRELSIPESQIYHLSIMPCFDKKLEAARKDFTNDEDQSKDVDCVITTKEVITLLNEKNLSFPSIQPSPLQGLELYKSMAPMNWPSVELSWLSNYGSSSGGFLEKVISQLNNKDYTLKIYPGKNNDITEYHIVDESTGEIISKNATIYGFRNIQNLVRKLKQKKNGVKARSSILVSRRMKKDKSVINTNTNTKAVIVGQNPLDYDYVEVMACPGGCINGGGQIGQPEGVNIKDWKDQVETVYQNMDKYINNVDKNALQRWVEDKFCQEYGISLSKIVTVEYHAIEDTLLEGVAASVVYGSKW